MLITPNLSLPYIDVNEAQREVVHNEAIRGLDALVQLAVLDRDLTAPPGAPSDGNRWIVGPSPTGAWAGHAAEIAAWQDDAWRFYAPQIGWFVYIVDEGAMLAYSGSAWIDALSMVSSLQDMALLGVGTTADATNPFSAKLNNTLWVAKTVAEGGDGDLRYKLSKESAAKTLSLLLQTNFSGRAELGLTGDDDLHLKVSADGSSWLEALLIDKSTGKVTLGQGFASPAGVRAQLYAAPFDALAFSGMQGNGDHVVSQEHGDTAVTGITATNKYLTDQWEIGTAGAAVWTVQRVSDAPDGLSHSLKYTVTTADASLAASDFNLAAHFIEGYRVARLAFGTSGAQSVSIGVWVKANITGTFSASIRNAAGDRACIRTFTIDAANTWEFKTFTFPGDTSGTWQKTTSRGLEFRISLGTGSDRQGTANQWNAGNTLATSGDTNLAATNSNTFQITGLIVLPGIELPSSDRLPLIMRPFDQELILCKRYWRKSYPYATALGSATFAGTEAFLGQGSNHVGVVSWSEPMCATTPNITGYNPNDGSTGSWRDNTAGANRTLTINESYESGFRYSLASTVDLNFVLGHWTANSRL